MAEDPYKPSAEPRSQHPRPVWRCAVLAVFAFGTACFLALPAGFVAYHEMSDRMLAGRRYATYDPEFFLFGQAVSSTTIFVSSLALAAPAVFLCVWMIIHAARNWRSNRTATN